MAYKFQVGDARLSGALVQEGAVTAESSAMSASSITLPGGGLSFDGTAVTSNAAELNFLDGFADAAYDESADSVVFFDATDSKLKRDAANDFATRLASTGLTAGSGRLTVSAAQTGITSLLATDIKIGEDDQTKIDFEDANKINFYVNNVKDVVLEENVFGPGADSEVDLGKTGTRWKDLYVDSATITDNVTIGGNLTVQGSTTTIESATLTVTSSVFFEGTIPDGNETQLIATNPTADRTITLPDLTGHVPLLAGAVSNANVTATEFALLDGGSNVSRITVADGDGVMFNDDGTMKHVDVRDIATYVGSAGARSTGYTLNGLDLDTIADGGSFSIASTGTGFYGTTADHTASFFIHLSGTWTAGDLVTIKSNASGSSSRTITVLPSGSDSIDGVTREAGGVVLESPFAAISCINDGQGSWLII
jgi:hypothetical protein